MSNQWEMKMTGVDELLSRFEQMPTIAERVTNEVLRAKSGKTAVTEIDSGTPISSGKLRNGHRHAHGAKPYSIHNENLGFIIRPKKVSKTEFEYLKYPDLGIGTSVGNAPRNFMRNGLDRSVPTIHDQIIEALDENLMK